MVAYCVRKFANEDVCNAVRCELSNTPTFGFLFCSALANVMARLKEKKELVEAVFESRDIYYTYKNRFDDCILV